MKREELTPQFQLAALTLLKDAVEAKISNLRQQIFDNVNELNKLHGVKAIDVKAQETTFASITLTERKGGYYVNETDFIEWVALNYPDEIVVTRTVRDSFRKHLLDTAEVTIDSQVVNPMTGEIIEGLVPKPNSKTIALRFKPDGRNFVADILAQGQTTISELFDQKELELKKDDTVA